MLLEPRDRIAPAPRLDLIVAAVGARVVGGRVPLQAIRDRLDERRALTRARPRDRLARDGDDRQQIVAVDAHAGQPVRLRLGGEVLRGGLLADRDADRPLVVSAKEDRLRLEDAGEVEADVELRGGGGAVAEVDERDVGPALQPRRPAHADGVRNLRRQRRADGREVSRLPRLVAGHLPALHRVVTVAEEVREEARQRQPAQQRRAVLAVGGEDPILGAHHVGRPDDARLLADRPGHRR